jgi:hypothetical protein
VYSVLATKYVEILTLKNTIKEFGLILNLMNQKYVGISQIEMYVRNTGRSRVRVPMKWIFSDWPNNPSSRTMTLGSTQSLAEMSTRNLPGDKGPPARKAGNLTAICEPTFRENIEASTSHNPMVLHGLLQG